MIGVELGQKQLILQLFLIPPASHFHPFPQVGNANVIYILHLEMSVTYGGSVVAKTENSLRNLKQRVCFKYLGPCYYVSSDFLKSRVSPKLKSKYAILTNRRLCFISDSLIRHKPTNQTQQQYTFIEGSLRLLGRVCDNKIKITQVVWEERFGFFMVMNSATLSDIFHNCGSSLSHGLLRFLVRNLTRSELSDLGQINLFPPQALIFHICEKVVIR